MKHKILYTITAATLALASCKKGFLDVNDDPNSVTEKTITPELIFPQAAASVGARAASRNYEFLNKWIGYWASSGSFVPDQTETTYNVSFGFGENIWQNHYNVLFDLHLTKVKALENGDSVLAGASMVLSAKLWQELADMFGNIPYSQAFQTNKYNQPAYDDAKAIYAGLLTSLDEAKTYLKKKPGAAFSRIDVVNHGNINRWIKFANTLKLRLLIRQSAVPGFDPLPEITKMKDGGAALNILRAGETIVVNPGYVNDVSKQSPFFATYGLTPSGAEANTLSRANAYFVNLLNSTSDPRLNRYFKVPAAGGAITGTVYGLLTGNPDGNHSSAIGAGLAESPTQDQWIMPSFLSMFLEAEAIARGWAPGDAQQAYEAAVRESFVFLKLPNAVSAANTYLTTQAIAMWANSGSSVLQKARFIAYQKYIALAGIDPQEAFSDLHRLNMLPDNGYLSVNPARISGKLPLRLPYAQSEYTTNSQNVSAQGTINIFNSKLFWQP